MNKKIILVAILVSFLAMTYNVLMFKYVVKEVSEITQDQNDTYEYQKVLKANQYKKNVFK